MNFVKPEMLIEAEKSRFKNIFLQIFMFFVVGFFIIIGQYFILAIMDLFFSFDYEDKYMIYNLFSTISGTVISIIYCRFIEKRPLFSMGVKKDNLMSSYLSGMVIGFLMLSGTVIINIVFGAMTFEGINNNLNVKIFFLYFSGFIVQGMSEEFIFRGFLMNSIGGKHNMILAIIISSSLFSLAHIMNDGVTVLALINIMLFGAFMSVYMIYSENIWGVSAIHSIWNFSQGNIFNINVSGTDSGETLFITHSLEGKTFINGGSFGIEGGIATTIILALSFLLFFMFIKRKKETE